MPDGSADNEIAFLKARLAETEALLAQSEESRRRLEQIVDEFRREKFGPKSEKLSPEQRNLPLEDVELAQGVLDAAQEKAAAALNGASPKTKDVRRNRGHLPKHLPRVEKVIEPESTHCPCGCGEMAKIGEDRSERLDMVPAQFRVLVTIRPKYACRRCAENVVQAHAPERVVPGGLPTEALIAHVIVSKFGDHLPFYRQAEIYARQGVTLDRATLGNWAGRACFHLQPVALRMRERLACAERVFMDETTAPVLEPGRGKTKTGYFWAIASDDRGHGGKDPPIVLFNFAPGRGGRYAETFLKSFTGRFLQVDGYAGYEKLGALQREDASGEKLDPKRDPWTLVYCWSHLRRRFVKVFKNTKSPVAEQAIKSIASLYAIEKKIRGAKPDIRLAERRKSSAPITSAFKPWLEAQLSRVSNGSKLAEAIRYALGHWAGLTRFLADGRLELDTNPVENAIRPIALTRKNALFAGHEVGAENWALLASLVATCKLNRVNPEAYVARTLEEIIGGHPRSDIDALMPWNF